MAKAHDLVQQFVGAAQKNPAGREAIYRQAASTFMGLAHDPKNAKMQGKLSKIGLEFANAAGQTEQQFTTDDFTDLLKETQASYQEVGDDEMDLIARRRQIHEERDPAGGQHGGQQISITPESFNVDAALGRSAQITGVPTADQIAHGIQQSQNVAFWQGDKKEAQAMTVDVSLGAVVPPAELPFVIHIGPPPLPLQTAPPFPQYTWPLGFGTAIADNISAPTGRQRPWAEVEYGSDGNRTKVRFDLGYGRRVSVVGNYIAVTVGVDGISQVLTAGASIGAFAGTSSGAPLICSQFIDQLPGQTRAIRQIPFKAVQLLPVMTNFVPGTTPQALIEFLDYEGAVLYSTYYTQLPNFTGLPIPLSADVGYVQVTSLVPSTTLTNFRLPFQLSM